MKKLIAIFTLTLISFNAMSQNEYPMKIAMVSVLVADPAKAFKFYTEVLGFEEVMFQPEHSIAIVKSPLEGNGTTILLEPTEPEGLEIAKQFKSKIYEMGLPCISFSAEDIYKTAEELKKKGVRFTQEPAKTDWGHEAIFDDDNGNFIQLFQAD